MVAGGVLVLTDAAFPCLYRRHDRIGMGQRRFRLGALRHLLQEAGFAWVVGHYFNAVSFLPAWLLARRDRWHDGRDPESTLAEFSVPPFLINNGMKLLMAGERGLLRFVGRLPFGVSLLCVGRKPASVPWPARSSPVARLVGTGMQLSSAHLTAREA